MAVFKCKMCGGDLNVTEGSAVAVCMYCETKQTVPSLDNEKKLNLFNRANRLRMKSEFDSAASIYENIIAEFPEEAEAYWGLCLCNYGIEYVDDPATGRKIPTCHRASFGNLEKDENFRLAMEYADLSARGVYLTEARNIDRINGEILSVSRNEEPYDIFICYKETDENGSRTIDSVLAQNLYDLFIAKGYKVFFARITLEDKLGEQYEPYIFAALNSATVMFCVGTKYEYFHAPWVRNEWSRFLKLSATDKRKKIIPCYKDIDAYSLPDEFRALQAQDLGKIGAEQDILRGLDKIFGKNKVSLNDNEKARENIRRELEKPQIIKFVNSIGSCDKNDCWPTGRYSNVVDMDDFSVIFFHFYVHSEKLRNLRQINLRFKVYDIKENLILDDKSTIAWQSNYDKFSKGWILRGGDNTAVPVGKYIMRCSVENSKEIEYEFKVTSRAERMSELRELQMKRKNFNLCQYCGNQFKQNIFGTLKCSKCGRTKDYQ